MPNNTAQESEFFAAIKSGRIDELKSLLRQAFDLIDSRSGDGCTPLHFAGSSEVVDILLDQGAARLDHFSRDAQASARGENLQYKCVPLENYQRILKRLG